MGFDICFFEWMDTYWKTWLQLAFPSYVVFLIVMVIIISEHSMKSSSRLIAKKNPVATLATVTLLLFLRMIITALSFANLDYPDGPHNRVWLPDASVEYLSVKYIALFIAAILILIVSIAYTHLLSFGSGYFITRKTLLNGLYHKDCTCHFIEPYHAPYEFKHRY